MSSLLLFRIKCMLLYSGKLFFMYMSWFVFSHKHNVLFNCITSPKQFALKVGMPGVIKKLTKFAVYAAETMRAQKVQDKVSI